MKISELQEAIKGWKHAGRDIAQMRAGRRDAAQPAVLVSIKKDGTESKMHDAKTYHASEDAARRKHADIVGLNPGRNIRHNLYVDGKLVGMLDKDTLAEDATSGATSTASGAFLPKHMGVVIRRPNLFGYVAPTKTNPKSKKKTSHHK